MTPPDSGPDGEDLLLIIVRRYREFGDFDGICENDYITVHGIGMEWSTYTTINGVQRSVPKMYSVDYDIIQ